MLVDTYEYQKQMVLQNTNLQRDALLEAGR